jgi:hypothetical protein
MLSHQGLLESYFQILSSKISHEVTVLSGIAALSVLIVSFLGSKPSSSDEQRLEPFFGHRLTP